MPESEININDYPLLRDNMVLIEVLEKIENEEKEVLDLICNIQKTCQHLCYHKNFIEDKGYVWGVRNEDMKVLVSKTCVYCGRTKERPNGAPWEVCYKCWGKMKPEEPFVPPDGGDTICTYKCKRCGHVVYGAHEKTKNGESD